MNGQRGMATERECERRRGGQSQTRRQQTKAGREEDGIDIQWRRRREGQAGGGGMNGSCDSVQLDRQDKVAEEFCLEQSFITKNRLNCTSCRVLRHDSRPKCFFFSFDKRCS